MFCAVLLAVCGFARAEDSSRNGGATAGVAPVAKTDTRAAGTTKDPDQRMFGVLPNFKTLNDPSVEVRSISAGQKFKLVGHYFDPFTFGYLTIQAGIEQATDAKPGYGQGLQGYGKRYGADFADGFTNELFVAGVFPTLLHQDPRYIRKGQGGGWARTGYALSRILVTRNDSGRHGFNFSEVLGNLSSGAISTLYYPKEDRDISGVFSRMSFQIGYDAMFNVLKEFYPDLSRKLFKKHTEKPHRI